MAELPAPVDLQGLTSLVRTQLARVPVRMRESKLTLSAWRMETASGQGDGSIAFVELPSGPTYRGEGTFLGWPQERLAAVWQALSNPPSTEPPFELPQLG
jgi:hypothetical protein